MPVIRNAHLYLKPGISFGRTGRDMALKCRWNPASVFDSEAPRLVSAFPGFSTNLLLALLNSNVATTFIKRFLSNIKFEISAVRQLAIPIPTPAQSARLERLAELAMAAKRHRFAGEPPADALVVACRALDAQLLADAPAYLHPPRQAVTFQKPDDCLAVIERAVNWEAEELYGVAGLGPFDEF
jgi:hypothetical protein